MFKRDDFKTFIVIGVVCIICLVIGLIVSFKSNTDKLTNVTEYNVFFSNVNYINTYISMVANNNEKAVYNLLDNRYINENNITLNDVLNNNHKYSDLSFFEADSMYYVDVKKDVIYYIKGSIYNVNHDGRELVDENFSILLINDISNNSYSLYPVNDDSYSKIINKIWNINIKKNEYNKFIKSEDIGIAQICSFYLSDFINNTFDGSYSSYNLLSDTMKKTYTSKESYEKFINNNFNLISSAADKCKLEELDDKRKYTVIDTNGNTYIFNEEYIMNYEVDFYLKEVSE